MHDKLFDNAFKKSLIFKDENKLDIDFATNRIPIGRGREISILSQLFLALLTNPNKISRKILITGNKGIGKTRTIKVFGEMITKWSKIVPIKYIHINCKKENSTQKILIQIIRLLNNEFPEGEYSIKSLKEALRILIGENPNIHILIALDNLNYIVKNKEDIISSIFSLTNVDEISFDPSYSFSIIGIVRNLWSITSSMLSSFQRGIIRFADYSREQLFDMLKNRAQISFREHVVSEKLIEFLAEYLYRNNIPLKKGLQLLRNAGKIAQKRNLGIINVTCLKETDPEFKNFLDLAKFKYPLKNILLKSHFNVSKYITLRIEGNSIYVYVKEKMVEFNVTHRNFIGPKKEIWEEYSKLRVWCKNDYDTNLLRYDLAFPLLMSLLEAGDSVASRVFRKEIAKGLGRGDFFEMDYLIYWKYINYLPSKTLIRIFSEANEKLAETISIILNTKKYYHTLPFSLLKILTDLGFTTKLLSKLTLEAKLYTMVVLIINFDYLTSISDSSGMYEGLPHVPEVKFLKNLNFNDKNFELIVGRAKDLFQIAEFTKPIKNTFKKITIDSSDTCFSIAKNIFKNLPLNELRRVYTLVLKDKSYLNFLSDSISEIL